MIFCGWSPREQMGVFVWRSLLPFFIETTPTFDPSEQNSDAASWAFDESVFIVYFVPTVDSVLVSPFVHLRKTTSWSSVNLAASNWDAVILPEPLLHTFGSQLWLYYLFCKTIVSRVDFHAEEAKTGNWRAIAACISTEIVWMRL